MTNIRDISDNVDQLIGRFDKKQRRSVGAVLDEWNSGEDEEFVFPIIDGPPGTGKTTVGTLAATKYLLENRRGKIVYMCYTNFAAERAKEKLNEIGLTNEQVVRLTSNPREKKWEEGIVGCRSDLSDLSQNEGRRLGNCRVLLCTLHGSRRALRIKGGRPRIIIDEFSQVTPPLFFATLMRVRREKRFAEAYALLGDPKQLPIITTQPLLKPNIGTYIMRRKPYRPHELIVQHRMHKDIADAVNSLRSALRTYPIENGKDVENRDLVELGFSWNNSIISDDKQKEILDPQHPFVIVDTSGLSGGEERVFGGSLRNIAEADLAARLALVAHRSYEDNRGNHLRPMILSPYSAQVAEIKNRLQLGGRPIGDCTTVYRAQGREYPCVIISFVWNNARGFIGFLEDPSLRAQTYVACSRAQAKLIVLLSRDTFVGRNHLDFDYLDDTKGAHRVEVG